MGTQLPSTSLGGTDYFGQKNNSRGFFGKLLDYGIGVAKIAGGVGEGLMGNPLGFAEAGKQAMGMVRDKIDGKY